MRRRIQRSGKEHYDKGNMAPKDRDRKRLAVFRDRNKPGGWRVSE